MKFSVCICVVGILASASAASFHNNTRTFTSEELAHKLERIIALSLMRGYTSATPHQGLVSPIASVLPKFPDPLKIGNTYINLPGGALEGTITLCNAEATGTSSIKDDLKITVIPLPSKAELTIEVGHIRLAGQHDLEIKMLGGAAHIVSNGDFSVDLKEARVKLELKVKLHLNGAFDIEDATVDVSFGSLVAHSSSAFMNGEPLDFDEFNAGFKDFFNQMWASFRSGVNKKVKETAIEMFRQCNAYTLLDKDYSCIKGFGKKYIADELFDEVSPFILSDEQAEEAQATCPPKPDPEPGDGSYLITSETTTNWGHWANGVHRCPAKSLAVTFQVKNEEWQFIGDDTSMNGIRLYCGGTQEIVTSDEGQWGKWGRTYSCEGGHIIGFQLRVESPGQPTDDTATNNIRIFCSSNPESYIEGDGAKFGDWRGVHKCKAGFGVCGIQTQIQPDQGPLKDDTALNNVAMLCCPVA